MLDPKQDHVIPGWALPSKEGIGHDPKEEFTVKRFRFVDVPRAMAGRQRFGESIGLITAAFYAEQGKAIAVGEGPEEKRLLETENFKAGRLLGVVQIRYVDEKEFRDK